MENSQNTQKNPEHFLWGFRGFCVVPDFFTGSLAERQRSSVVSGFSRTSCERAPPAIFVGSGFSRTGPLARPRSADRLRPGTGQRPIAIEIVPARAVQVPSAAVREWSASRPLDGA